MNVSLKKDDSCLHLKHVSGFRHAKRKHLFSKYKPYSTTSHEHVTEDFNFTWTLRLFYLCEVWWKFFFKHNYCTLVTYGRPFVSKLWHDIRAVFSLVYLQSFLLHDIRAFFVTYTCVLFPSIWPFSYKRAYICAQKNPIYMRYKQACGTCGRRKSSYKRHRIIPSAKNTFMYDGAEK